MFPEDTSSPPFPNEMNGDESQSLSRAEHFLHSGPAEQDPGPDESISGQQCRQHFRVDRSGNSNISTETHPFPLWPRESPVSEYSIDWAQLLEDCHTETGLQDTPNAAASPLDQHCTCFALALSTIQRLSEVPAGTHIQQIGHNLEELARAVKLCESFSNCSQSCHEEGVLLYITILEQVRTHCLSLNGQILSIETNCQDSTMEVVVGGFAFKIGFGSDIGQAILKEKLKGALVCTTNLARKLQHYVDDGCEAEMKYSQQLLSSLADSIGRHLTAIGDRPAVK